MDWVKNWRAQYLVYYLRLEKKLVYEHRVGDLTDASYTVKIHVPEAKRIVFGRTGNHQPLLDVKHDDRPAVNLGSEYRHLVLPGTPVYRNTRTPEHRNIPEHSGRPPGKPGTPPQKTRNTHQKARNIFQNTKKSAKSLRPDRTSQEPIMDSRASMLQNRFLLRGTRMKL